MELWFFDFDLQQIWLWANSKVEVTSLLMAAVLKQGCYPWGLR